MTCWDHSFNYQPCLIHGDLGPYHILFDRRSSRLSGIPTSAYPGLAIPPQTWAICTNTAWSFVSVPEVYPQLQGLMKRRAFTHRHLVQWCYLVSTVRRPSGSRHVAAPGTCLRML
jgi:hypothetical protein